MRAHSTDSRIKPYNKLVVQNHLSYGLEWRALTVHRMDIIAEIKQKMAKHPELQIEKERNSVSVTPEGGFTVWAIDHGDSYTIGFDGWHEEFSDPEEALNCFAWGLSDDCRLKIVSRNGKPHKWSAQYRSNGNWINGSTTGLVLVQFWRKPTVEYKHNAIINS